jgi:hypothetical protein
MRHGAWYAVVVLSLPAVAAAEPVLHERIFFGSSAGMHCKGGVCTQGDEVRAIEQNGHMLPAPSDGPQPAPGEQVFSPEPEHAPVPSPGGPPLPGDPPPERRPMVSMDRETGTDAQVSHTYHSVFTPSEFPYKRMSALDWANEDEMLAIFDPQRVPVPKVGASAREPDRDAFWGSIVVDLEPGKWIPLPSVSPEARLLDYRTEPASRPGALEFSRDGADNFFVRATLNGGAGGRRRLIWLTDASQFYFSGPLGAGRLDEEPKALLRPLPAKLRRTAIGVLEAIGLRPTPHMPLRILLDPLVTHFRAFETGKLPAPSESTYRDLALGQKGVCRHRSYAFVITALAAGIPARYVENELHVFVEVYLPRVGWRRINLGGAALDDQLVGADDKPMHQPHWEDELPRPPQYEANNSPPSHRPKHGRGRGNGSGEGSGPGRLVDLGALIEQDEAVVERSPQKLGTVLTLVADSGAVYRGDTIEVSGQAIEKDGGRAADLPIEIYLDGVTGAQRIAETRSGPDGRFVALALVPSGVELGRYRIVARTPGDATRKPSSTRPR